MRFLSFVLLFSIFSCSKDTKSIQDHPVPSVPVDLTAYPNDPSYFKVQNVGGWMYVNGGIRGIILYRKSNEEFVALERSSPDDPNNAKDVCMVKSDNFSIRDTLTNSEWRIIDGTVTKGPAKWALRQYGTVYDGNVLRVRN